MKFCNQCKKFKSFNQFNKSTRNKDGLHGYCRECQKIHYQNNKSRHLVNTKRTRVVYREKVIKILSEALAGGCADCGNVDLRVLDFDHVRGIKIASIGKMLQNGNKIKMILEELKKCEVRCKNCHAIVTYERLGGSWRDMPL